MPRPRADGTPARAVNKRKLNDRFVATQKAADRDRLIWDSHQPGLTLCVRVTGRKSWKIVYRFHGRPVWLHLGDARSIGLADARRLAARVMLDVACGGDPISERRAKRDSETFTDLASRYVELHARKHNKSWKQAEKLVARYLLPRWGKLKASAITRADVRAAMIRIEAPDISGRPA
jgi:2-polyprenyl-3-methyl-5-hydroxy-6-metoxy-1,4-benzoquinol methylase